jgi:hypothetical protein
MGSVTHTISGTTKANVMSWGGHSLQVEVSLSEQEQFVTTFEAKENCIDPITGRWTNTSVFVEGRLEGLSYSIRDDKGLLLDKITYRGFRKADKGLKARESYIYGYGEGISDYNLDLIPNEYHRYAHNALIEHIDKVKDELAILEIKGVVIGNKKWRSEENAELV